ncbi:hypothetical protein Bealeia1_00749 [Candidatus Bealeia paramacronuclearis]|uniref:Uncharacterized protein n=1 Tax=Candidatus Bealeia paramacronuclearis TaxID=1921001 RepID=A0ABZ2C556_9PROT|nr:hypothetical protein [Candidatus Bealeia paramacronuclearis]
MTSKNFFGSFVIGLVLVFASENAQGGRRTQISWELDNLNEDSVQKLNSFWLSYQGDVDFKDAVTPMQEQIIRATKKIVQHLPSDYFQSESTIQEFVKFRGISDIFSFLARWPIEKEDLEEDTKAKIETGMKLVKTFPDLLDFDQAQFCLPALEQKFGRAEPYNVREWYQLEMSFFKTQIRARDYIDQRPYRALGFMLGLVGTTCYYFMPKHKDCSSDGIGIYYN